MINLGGLIIMTNLYNRLNGNDRFVIQTELNDGASFNSIATVLGKHPATISREVRKYSSILDTYGYGGSHNRCIHLCDCEKHDLCTAMATICKRKSCSRCRSVNCNTICPDYEEEHCEKLAHAPYVCNGCEKFGRCRFLKKIYRASEADKLATQIRSESRSGIAMSEEEIEEFNSRISPLLLQGQSIHHIMVSNPDWFTISEKTAYMLVHCGCIDAKPLDLPRMVRYKPRKKSKELKVDKKCRINRTYDDFLAYMKEHPDVPVLQGDSVEGKKGGKVLLTLTWETMDFQLGFLREHNDSASVTAIVNALYESLGCDTFHKVMPSVWLLDNGTEFSNPTEIEKFGIRVFYCNPSSPYQKGACENTHELFRRFIPKGTSFDSLTQKDIDIIFSHSNALIRKKLNNRSAYDVFSLLYGDDIDIESIFHIKYISPNDVVLHPRLLQTTNKEDFL